MLEAGFNVDSRQLLMAETEVYGLISGPSWLRQSLVADLAYMGYQRNRQAHYGVAIQNRLQDQ
eukprot:4091832-Karenia_brevis.AAC.1